MPKLIRSVSFMITRIMMTVSYQRILQIIVITNPNQDQKGQNPEEITWYRAADNRQIIFIRHTIQSILASVHISNC